MRKPTKVEPILESLLQAYAIAAAKHGKATRDSDPETTNEQGEIIETVYRELRSRGPKAQLHLLELFDNPDANVRLWAASHALEFAPEQAVPVLEELLNYAEGWTGFDAQIVLEEWRKGTLEFP